MRFIVHGTRISRPEAPIEARYDSPRTPPHRPPPPQVARFNGMRTATVAAPKFVDAAFTVSIQTVGRRSTVSVEAAKKS